MSTHFNIKQFFEAFNASSSDGAYCTDKKRSLSYEGTSFDVPRTATRSEAVLAYIEKAGLNGISTYGESFTQTARDALERFLNDNPNTAIEDLSCAVQCAKLMEHCTRNIAPTSQNLANIWQKLNVPKTDRTLEILKATWYKGKSLAQSLELKHR